MPGIKSLEKKIFIKGQIKAITGLHIGGTNTELSIGGMDNAVIRNPITFEPYIPGSSLKGKMRSLTELAHNTFGEKGMNREVQITPTNNPEHLAAQLFGYTQFDKEKDKKPEDRRYYSQQPSRVIVRDCRLQNSESLAGILVEEKAETVIDRITSAAMPRQMERVPAGAQFSLEIIVNIFSGEQTEEESIHGLLHAMRLVEDDYLGGAGSRGSGQVYFWVQEIKGRPMSYYTSDTQEEEDLLNKYANAFPDLFKDKAAI